MGKKNLKISHTNVIDDRLAIWMGANGDAFRQLFFPPADGEKKSQHVKKEGARARYLHADKQHEWWKTKQIHNPNRRGETERPLGHEYYFNASGVVVGGRRKNGDAKMPFVGLKGFLLIKSRLMMGVERTAYTDSTGGVVVVVIVQK